ncbi:MAG: hypothetical protein K1X94_09500 [Sandaracinaceae bacterium]|nr:hypothetical protein [Sandaracinaceae bacterium]
MGLWGGPRRGLLGAWLLVLGGTALGGGTGCGRLSYDPRDAAPSADAASIDAPTSDVAVDAARDATLDTGACLEGTACPGGICRAGSCCTGCWDPVVGACHSGDALEQCGAAGRTCRACSCLGDACASGVCAAASPFEAVQPGDTHTCAIRSGGDVLCWGNHTIGQTGTGPLGAGTSPRAPAVAVGAAREINGSHEHVCARTDTGVVCWGRGWEGQLGDGAAIPSGTPTSAFGAGAGHLDTGFIGSALVSSTGAAFVWGRNTAEGFLGLGAITDDIVRPAMLVGTGAVDVGLGHTHGCVVLDTGRLLCFGGNDTGQLGLGATSAAVTTPTETTGLESVRVVEVDGGFVHTCALDDAGGLWCTGGNLEGSLGLGDREMRVRFERVGTARYRALSVAARGLHTCALTVDDVMHCWGANESRQIAAQLGDSIDVPTVIDLGPVVGIGAGVRHSCAITLGGALYCWGDDAQGQVNAGVASVGPSDVVRVCAP